MDIAQNIVFGSRTVLDNCPETTFTTVENLLGAPINYLLSWGHYTLSLLTHIISMTSPSSDQRVSKPKSNNTSATNRTRAYHKPASGKKPIQANSVNREQAKPIADGAHKRPHHRKPGDKKAPYKGRDRNQQGGGGGRGRRRPPSKPKLPTQHNQSPNSYIVPTLKKGDIRVVPVCGVEWIGTNMSFVEYNDEIVVIDAGFGFGDPDTPGASYTLPNTTYLRDNKEKVKALVITHGHLDHVGGIPFLIEDLGFPTIYTREFGAMFIKKKLEEFPQLAQKVKIEIIESHMGYVPLSDSFKVKFFGLTHSIPDSTGVIIQTPFGGIVSTGDVRVETDNGIVRQSEHDQYEFFKDENILMLLMDSTGIEKPGWSISEDVVIRNIDTIIENVVGRLFIAAFSSQVERLLLFMESAKKHGKYIAFEGRSIKSNMGIAEHLELTDFGHVIPLKEIDKYPPNKVVVILTGAQGEEFAALNRIANESHREIKLRPDDTVILSSSVVPGNHHQVLQLKNNLYKGSYNIITYVDNQVHASGHGTREELLWIHKQIPYKFFAPVHGDPYMIRMHARIAQSELGITADRLVIPSNGSIIEIRDEGKTLVKIEERIPHERIIVDGNYQGVLHKVLMDDRKHLAEHGMFVVVISVDARTGKLKKSPDIISRGFVYLRESQRLLSGTRTLVKKLVEAHTSKNRGKIEFDEVKKIVADKVEKHLLQQTGKDPIVIPVVLSV